jgi:type 1 fimbria pilin
MKHMNWAKAAVVVTLASAAVAAEAAPTLDMTVVGKISPTPCTLDFDGGNSLDFEETKASALSKTDYTVLTTKQTAAVIDCIAPIKIGFSVVDDRAASAISDAAMKKAIAVGTDNNLYGLGTAGTVSIGSYSIDISTIATVDNTQATNNVYSTDSGKTWTKNEKWLTPGANYIYSAGSASAGPTVGAKYRFPMTVRAALNKVTVLNVVNKIDLNGQATFELKYL